MEKGSGGRTFALALSFAAAAIAAPPVPKDTVDLRELPMAAPLKAPELLLFDVIWGGWSFNWVHAGTASLDLLPTPNPKV